MQTLLKHSSKDARLTPDKVQMLLFSFVGSSPLVGGVILQNLLHGLKSNLLLSLTKRILLERSETFFLSIQDGCLPLLLAVEAGNVGIVRELLSAQSEPQLRAVKTVSTA